MDERSTRRKATKEPYFMQLYVNVYCVEDLGCMYCYHGWIKCDMLIIYVAYTYNTQLCTTSCVFHYFTIVLYKTK